MPLRLAHLATLPLLLAACGDERVAPEPFVSACPLVAPVRLAGPPAGWSRRPTRTYPFRALGDRLLYSFSRTVGPRAPRAISSRARGRARRRAMCAARFGDGSVRTHNATGAPGDDIVAAAPRRCCAPNL